MKNYFELVARLLAKLKYKSGLIFNNYTCCCCYNRVPWYKPLPEKYRENANKYGYRFFGRGEMTNVKAYSCPICGASDRDRFYALYLSEILNNKPSFILDIAPSKPLSKFLSRISTVRARTCDLYMKEVDDNANIEDLQCYGNDMFDALICSHVLEHVGNPDMALKELYRVLKPGGFAILMVPICMDINNSIEDPSHDTPELRWRHYGQDDHLRLFARNDFINRIRNAGFQVQLLDIKYFGRKAFRENGLKTSSTLYLGWKEKK